LRARPEPTQLEHFPNASFLGELLVLPTNVRLNWKVISRYKHSSLFGLINSEKNKFLGLKPGLNVIKLFSFVADDKALRGFALGNPFQ
jgi:hypothetical protein